MKKYLFLTMALFVLLISSCDKKSESDCGDAIHSYYTTYRESFFLQPSEIYWGVSGNTRSYTINWTAGNICTAVNPKVTFTALLFDNNSTLSNPFSFSAGTYTCLGVSAQHAAMLPNASQIDYDSQPSEIGMQQCFSGQSSATIYPYITVSFTTLGSSEADSLYLFQHISSLSADVAHNKPK